jgi:hypothetical protein
MNKCEWRDGKFYPCEDAYKFSLLAYDKQGKQVKFCPFCGADIRKPEPEVIIKKSGETWVSRYDGVDYLCGYDPHDYDIAIDKERIEMFSIDMESKKSKWKPISEIEITDDIAKLRPMVVDGGRDYSDCKLWGVCPDTVHAEMLIVTMDDFCYWSKRSDIRLATVSDL